MMTDNQAGQDEPCQVIAFPLHARVGKARDVAAKVRTKRSDEHVESYSTLVSKSLGEVMARLGVNRAEIALQLTLFWSRVGEEMSRQDQAEKVAKAQNELVLDEAVKANHALQTGQRVEA
jgi:Family of unknown function (DUF6074)